MVELIARGLSAGLLVLAAGWLGALPFPTAIVLGVWTLAYAVAAYHWDQQGKTNSGSAGIVACFDAATLAAIFGAADRLDTLGFLVLAPIAYAAARHGSLPSAMAPIAVSSLFAVHQFFGDADPTPTFYAQSVGVLAIGLLLNHRRIVVTVTRNVVGKIEPMSGQEPEGFLELRESFRQLRTMYRDLERSSRRDAAIARLLETRFPTGERFHPRLAQALQQILGADGLCLYAVATLEDRLVVRAAVGKTPESAATDALRIDLTEAPGRIKHQLDKTLIAQGSGQAVANVVLVSRGKAVGLLSLRADEPDRLDDMRQAAEEFSAMIADLMVEEERKESEAGRLRQSELLYETAVVAQGAETKHHIAARVVRELDDLIDVDYLAIHWLDGHDLVLAAGRGERTPLFEALSFAGGAGVEGWLRSESPELMAFDSREDLRALPAEMVKRRIGSFAILPLDYGEGPLGVLMAVTRRTGGIDLREQEILRVVSHELARAIGALDGAFGDGEGLVTPDEFAHLLEGEGCVVTLEPLRRELTLEKFGRPSLDDGLRRYSRRLRAKLPPGAALCRRPQGDLVAFLKACDSEEAQRWANEAAALASLVALTAPDGRSRTPLGIRARVSRLEGSPAIIEG